MRNDVKYISINGKIQIPDELSHQDFLLKLHKFLKNEGSEYHFKGTTRIERTDNDDNINRRQNETK